MLVLPSRSKECTVCIWCGWLCEQVRNSIQTLENLCHFKLFYLPTCTGILHKFFNIANTVRVLDGRFRTCDSKYKSRVVLSHIANIGASTDNIFLTLEDCHREVQTICGYTVQNRRNKVGRILQEALKFFVSPPNTRGDALKGCRAR